MMIEVIGHVDEQHRLHVDLPDDIPTGPVNITLRPVTAEDEEADFRALLIHSWARDWSDPREDIYTLEDGTPSATPQPAATPLAADEILRVARQDAERAYRDLTRFRISLFLEPDGWHVEYRLTKPFVAGGGPHYVIDPVTGTILSKKYYQ